LPLRSLYFVPDIVPQDGMGVGVGVGVDVGILDVEGIKEVRRMIFCDEGPL